jgi:Tol biopolymer transport system component
MFNLTPGPSPEHDPSTTRGPSTASRLRARGSAQGASRSAHAARACSGDGRNTGGSAPPLLTRELPRQERGPGGEAGLRISALMSRKLIALLSLALAALACDQLALPISTSVATVTALAPTVAPPTVPNETVATETPASTSLGFACSLAYTEWNAESSRVYCLGEGGPPFSIAEASSLGTVSTPAISSDGAFVAYMINQISGVSQLWVVNVTGLPNAIPSAHLLVGADQVPSGDPNIATSPFYFAWQLGTHQLFFNTRFTDLAGGQGPAEQVNNDLWQADADSGKVVNVLPHNSARRFFVSPDGKHIALSLAEAVGLMDADGSHLNLPLKFPLIKTYGEYLYQPEIWWNATNAFFYFVIPSPDPLASDASATIYRMALDGTTQTLGVLTGDFVLGGSVTPTVSPDGQFVVYSRTGADNTATLYLARIDGSGETPIDQQPSTVTFTGLGWAPDSNHFAYAVVPSIGGFLVSVAGLPQPFAPNAQVRQLIWQARTSFTFYGQVNGEWGLYFQRLGEAAQVLVPGLSEGVNFDGRR